jgi:hypothetical protein
MLFLEPCGQFRVGKKCYTSNPPDLERWWCCNSNPAFVDDLDAAPARIPGKQWTQPGHQWTQPRQSVEQLNALIVKGNHADLWVASKS